ncbi:MAG: hypothetical protein IJG84_11330 [Kiritimatiellae bacterium]|nr:hypothetical protein [Kiritimatiellia bacterium]
MSEKKKIAKRLCSILHLVLKRKWYDMIASGEKLEEYRTSDKVKGQIDKWYGHALINGKMSVVVFHDGYRRDRRSMAFLACKPEVRNRSSNPDWGEPHCDHYVIHLVNEVELVSNG